MADSQRSFALARPIGARIESSASCCTPKEAHRPIPIASYPADPNDRLFYFNDLFGRAYSHILQTLLRPGDCVVDVGANIGHFSLVAAQWVGVTGRVHAIEANPALAKRLDEIAAEFSDGPLRVHHAAVWHTAGQVSFNIAAEMSGWSSLVQNETFKTASVVEVPAITLDDFAGQKNSAQCVF